MKLIGLTGGIGMGKSTASELLAQHGLPVIDTDELARQVVIVGGPALREIEKEFGSDILQPNGELDRRKLAQLVFNEPGKRLILESILHPRIRRLWVHQADLWKQEGRPAGVVVIPLLFETDASKAFDLIICVACSVRLQHQRLGLRGWTDEEIDRRNSAQWPVEKKISLSTYVAWNESPIPVLAAQLERIISSTG
ncbi:MAG: dephospho-CoA kinase [Opitutaceae bacterium]|nr:dephospho-CoA kinase [Verrucomicrobiales bacterium]